MPRFSLNRRWTFILTVIAFATVLAWPSSNAYATGARGDGVENPGDAGIGAPLPQGEGGDPDHPTPTGLRAQRRETIRTGGELLSTRTSGEGRVERTVWMMRLEVMRQLLRAYWVRQ